MCEELDLRCKVCIENSDNNNGNCSGQSGSFYEEACPTCEDQYKGAMLE